MLQKVKYRGAINKSELIERLVKRFPQLSETDVFIAVNLILNEIAASLARGERIEIRGMGSFTIRYRAPRMNRNPKTGAPVKTAGKYFPNFKAGKELRERVGGG
jgi:integration host factor subunit beta